MDISWGYSPKIEKYIPLGEFPADRYLIIARQAVENLGWKLSHLSETGLIAYTGLSLQSYSEEISIRIVSNFAIVKSECIGVQMLFNDYGKNALNLDKFFHEFEYVEFHLKEVWEERMAEFHGYISTQDETYFERAPLTAKNKIKNVFYLFAPRSGYVVTPIILNLNVFYWLFGGLIFGLYLGITGQHPGSPDEIYLLMGANNRSLVLDGQVWRLVSSIFMHLTFSHLFLNMYALVYIGLMIENKYGSWKTLSIYLMTGIASSLSSLVFHDERWISLGASGAIMGMFGAFLALLLSRSFEKNATRALLISTLFLIAIMLVNGLSSVRVDNAAHIGGLIWGFLIGSIFADWGFMRLNTVVRYVMAFMLTACIGLAVFFLTPNYQTKEFTALREQFVQNSENFNRIYRIERDLPVEEKLREVQTSGIEVWKKNLQLVKKMEGLVLDQESKIYRAFCKRVAQIGYKASVLIYKEYQTGNKSKHQEIVRLMQSMYDLRMTLDTEIKNLKK
jgi:rhomboid protease GluP